MIKVIFEMTMCGDAMEIKAHKENILDELRELLEDPEDPARVKVSRLTVIDVPTQADSVLAPL